MTQEPIYIVSLLSGYAMTIMLRAAHNAVINWLGGKKARCEQKTRTKSKMS